MFILRRLSSKGAEMNFALGKSYTVIHKDFSPEEFKATLENFSLQHEEGIYAFVSDEDGKDIHRLYKNQRAYIMTSDGNTFSNETYKD